MSLTSCEPNFRIKPVGKGGPQRMNSGSMLVGQLGKCVSSDWQGRYLLKTYNGYVLVDRAGTTWSANPNMEVELPAPGESIEIVFT